MRLGWAHGDQEIFSVSEMIQFFSLDHVGKKGSIFDPHKLDWVNSVYIKAKTPQELLTALIEQVDPSFVHETASWHADQREKAIFLYKERVKTLKELRDCLVTLYTGPDSYVQDDVEQWLGDAGTTMLDQIVRELSGLAAFDHDTVAGSIKTFCKHHDLKLVAVAQPLRLALTGSTASPGIFDLLALVGKEETMKRVHALKQYLEAR